MGVGWGGGGALISGYKPMHLHLYTRRITELVQNTSLQDFGAEMGVCVWGGGGGVCVYSVYYGTLLFQIFD